MTEQAIPAALYRARIRSRSLDNWGLSWALLLVACALSGAVVGVEVASHVVFAVAFLAVAVGLRTPGIGLMGIGVLATLETVLRVTAFGETSPLRFNTINYWLVLYSLFHARYVLHLRQLTATLHMLLIVVLAVGLLWAPTITRGLTNVLRVTAGLGLIVYFKTCPPSQHRMLLWTAISTSAIATIFGVLLYTNPVLVLEFNPNDLAMLPLTGLFTIFLATFAKVVKRREMDVLMLLAASNLGVIFLSASRGAILTALFLWLAILAWGFNLPRKIAYGAGSVFIVLGLVALSPQFQEYALKRLERTFDESKTVTQRTSGRWDLAKVGWALFLEHPLGVGTGGFRESMSRFYDPGVKFWGRPKPPESAWIGVLAENGVPGIAVMFLYVASFAWTGLRRRNRELLMVGLIASGVLALRFLSGEFEWLGVFWISAGSSFLLHRSSAVVARSER